MNIQEKNFNSLKKINNEVYVLLPMPFRVVGWVVSSLALIALIFLASMDVAKKEQVKGILHSPSDAIPIQSPVEGVVNTLLVSEGDHVKKGQPLFSISQQSYTANQSSSIEDDAIHRLKENLNERIHVINNLPSKHTAARNAMSNKLQSLDAQIPRIESQYNAAQTRLQLSETQLKRLEQKSENSFAVSSIELNRQKDSALALRQQVDELAGQKLKISSELAEVKSSLEMLSFTQEQERQMLNNEINGLKTQIAEFHQKKERVVVAAMDGIVENIQVKLGKQVTAGQSQMHLVPPHQALQLTIYAPARTVAFIAKDQDASIRYDDFPYQRFGSYKGSVVRVSRSAIMPGETARMAINEPSYEIDVKIERQNVESYGKQFDLKSGMIAEVYITTERRSLLYWLFEPVLSIQDKF